MGYYSVTAQSFAASNCRPSRIPLARDSHHGRSLPRTEHTCELRRTGHVRGRVRYRPFGFFSYFFLILNSPERRADAPQCRHWDLGALPSKKPAIPSTRSNRNRTVAGQQDVLW